ncbi:MaoC-like dehydratase [Renibacterium salmoninarum ATCC 33209]|uniref:MaoC-like dehydratase n=1 Tax=Renibacterium salmoninarum (strain ATCC 33209 / DSM 20767 / JCM 11484 / NBRC 15589 / NCIMB 2235) TaxID=288705 RepID=A9WNF7_RENSM|nr:MaoC family dehydratase [Renibacterium salmoninarum]ABY22684.1 MaoC-like dehydratase [Renibacterium salmoninarum ATCC 33209]
MSKPDISTLSVGDSIGTQNISFSRADLVRYAGASGDFNPIHWNERFAQEVELPGVIAHGMLTMGAAVQLAVDWVGNPGAVLDYQTRFTKPVLVPDVEAGSVIEVRGVIGALDVAAGTARVDLTVLFNGEKALVKAQAIVRLS